MKLHIPNDKLSHHIQIVGATGTRKSSIIRGLVDQAIERGWPCVFLDVKREYLQEYYVEGRDYPFDFGDNRCIRWMIGQEAIDEPHAMPLGAGAFPDEPGRSFFFQEHARAILAYLIGVYHPRLSELGAWISRPEEIDKRVKGSEHESTLSKNSADQRNGVLATLNHLGRVLRWMPDDEGRREITVDAWAKQGKQRKGHIFLSSSPNTFEALRPMQSLILDMVFLGLQTYGGPALVVADEIGRFQRVPQLEPALSLQRSSGCPIILAYQDFAQIEQHYGEKLASAITSNPYTQIVLRTGNERSARYCSSLLGMATEKERIRESMPVHKLLSKHGNHTYWSERVMESAVTPGEIQSLEDGHGYLAQAGCITPIHVAYRPPKPRVPKLIKRTVYTQPNNLEVQVKQKPDYTKKKTQLALVTS